MLNMHNLRKLVIVTSLTAVAPAFAVTASAAVAAPQAASAAGGFSIAASAPLTLELVDKCWANREDTTNQKIIADYLMTMPAVDKNYELAWKTARLVYFIGNYGDSVVFCKK